jgi:hypothetical protein
MGPQYLQTSDFTLKEGVFWYLCRKTAKARHHEGCRAFERKSAFEARSDSVRPRLAAITPLFGQKRIEIRVFDGRKGRL